jgi:hypothetical protein
MATKNGHNHAHGRQCTSDERVKTSEKPASGATEAARRAFYSWRLGPFGVLLDPGFNDHGNAQKQIVNNFLIKVLKNY